MGGQWSEGVIFLGVFWNSGQPGHWVVLDGIRLWTGSECAYWSTEFPAAPLQVFLELGVGGWSESLPLWEVSGAVGQPLPSPHQPKQMQRGPRSLDRVGWGERQWYARCLTASHSSPAAPEDVVRRQEALAAARLKMQEELNAQVERHKEKLRQVGCCPQPQGPRPSG